MNMFILFVQALSAIGAMNWGFVVFFNFNCVDYLLSRTGTYTYRSFVYGVVAIAGLYSFLLVFMPA